MFENYNMIKKKEPALNDTCLAPYPATFDIDCLVSQQPLLPCLMSFASVGFSVKTALQNYWGHLNIIRFFMILSGYIFKG